MPSSDRTTMMLTRCNRRIIALPFPTVALLAANAASTHFCISRAYCFHPSRSLVRNHRHNRLHTTTVVYSRRQQHGAATPHYCRLLERTQNNSALSTRGAQQKKISLRRRRRAATGRLHIGNNDECDEYDQIIISSVRDSLWYDLIEPHLCSSRLQGAASYSSSSHDDTHTSTLVLLLAVSGGCDSMALFHSTLALLTRGDDSIYTTSNDGYSTSSDRSVDVTTAGGDNNQRLWLHLGSDESNNTKQLIHRKIPCELHVAHFNHEQRGERSDGDEMFVKTICMKNNIPCHSFYWSDEDSSYEEAYDNGDDRLDTTTKFTQDVARNWRRRKLKELLLSLVRTSVVVAESSHTDTTSRWGAILTAHHRDDADETILLKLLRGAHLTNIRGMDARSDGFELSLEDGYSSIGYFVKPMLQIRKYHIMNYLTSNSLEWREDDSNNSSKYKRNKIRNELIPLLSEIAGGDAALQKRLLNLEEQSRDISHYLSERAQDYLESMPSSSTFTLNSNTEYDLVQEEAMHTWMIDQSNNELQVSYDKMRKIRDQIQNHHDRRQWEMDMGDNWTLSRNGRAFVISKGDGQYQPSSNSAVNPWFVCVVGPDGADMSHEYEPTNKLHFACWLPTSVDVSTIKIDKAKDCTGVTFLPPWRNKRSEIKLKDFLRGQRVPLHRRNESNILCFSDNTGKRHALAVHLENTDEWIVNANFCPRDDLPITKIVLWKA
jgi:tRNA(Ile)-lysidine synthetase-like protein